MWTTELERLKQLESSIPDIWNCFSVLYIGANKDRFHFKNALKEQSMIVDVLEIDPDRCEELKKEESWLYDIFCEDVVNIDKVVTNKHDLIIWSHGPEILFREAIAPTIEKLISKTKKILVMMCPWGKYKYTDDEMVSLEPNDINRTALYPDDFLKLGFNVSAIGKKDVNGSNLLAWKYI